MREKRLAGAEAEACDWEHDLSGESSGASDLLPRLKASGCNRDDNLETTFDDAIVSFVESC
jgi:hypothetical protein